MNNFHNCMSDLDLWGGEPIDPAPPSEADDTALTTWLDARQPIFEEFDDADPCQETGK